MDSNQIVATLSKADIFLLPSISEGLSNAALEAMSMELPVISTLAGGMNEVIKDGENGLLVGLFSPDQISQRIAFLIENQTEARKLGQNARKTVLDRFQIQQQIRVFSEVYQQLTSSSDLG
jgi:glycosyltransferase involved in cell wall biosynthesis